MQQRRNEPFKAQDREGLDISSSSPQLNDRDSNASAKDAQVAASFHGSNDNCQQEASLRGEASSTHSPNRAGPRGVAEGTHSSYELGQGGKAAMNVHFGSADDVAQFDEQVADGGHCEEIIDEVSNDAKKMADGAAEGRAQASAYGAGAAEGSVWASAYGAGVAEGSVRASAYGAGAAEGNARASACALAAVLANSRECDSDSMHLVPLKSRGDDRDDSLSKNDSLGEKVKSALSKCYRVRPTVLAVACASLLGAATLSAPAYAAGAMPQLNHAKNAVVNQGTHNVGTVMQVTGNGNNALLVWDSFNVGAGNAVHFNTTTGKGASFLNIVKGPGASHIDGNIIDNTGKSNMYLINPNGICVGRTGSIEHFKSVYLGTAKPSQEVIDSFKDANAQPLTKDVLPQNRGMGKVTLMRTIDTDDLKIVGGHIIIGAADEVFSAAEADNKIELISSVNRVDIGGKLDAKLLSNRGMSYRELLEKNGIKAASEDKIKADGTHEKNTFVDHSKQIGIYGADQLEKINNNMAGDYWLVTDINVEDHAPIGKDQGQAFSGTLDGTFNSITYKTEANDGGDFGLFAQTDGASIKNLKVYKSEVTLGAGAKGKDLYVGAIAGTMKNTKLNNIDVTDFAVKQARRPVAVGKNSTLGGVAGKMSGNNKLTNAVVTMDKDSALKAASDLKAGKIASAGVLAGEISGQLEQSGVVAAIAVADTKGSTGNVLHAVSKNDAGAVIAESYEDAVNTALNGGMTQDEINALFATSGTAQNGDLKLSGKGFLKPFFVEDFNFTYDGKVHSYLDLVNNEGFDIRNMLDKTDARDYSQKDAGYYDFAVTTRKENQEAGHDFYFSYKYAGETWNNHAGGDASMQDRTNRADGLAGNLTLNINKKKVSVDLADQIVEWNEQPNLSAGNITIGNLDELLQNGLVAGDTLADLGIKLEIGNDGSITGTSSSKNYEVEINPGKLTVLPKPQPKPEPKPEPLPSVPEVQPQPQQPVEPQDNDVTLPTVAKCSHCGNLGNYINTANLPAVPHERGVLVGMNDYSTAMMAALMMNTAPQYFNSAAETLYAQARSAASNSQLALASNTPTAPKDKYEDDTHQSTVSANTSSVDYFASNLMQTRRKVEDTLREALTDKKRHPAVMQPYDGHNDNHHELSLDGQLTASL